MSNTKSLILEFSRQNNIGPLTHWFDRVLDDAISKRYDNQFLSESEVIKVGDNLVSNLKDYSSQTGLKTAVLGMSGGVDSALVAAMFKRAGWRVIGVTMPIAQDPIETERGTNACKALNVEHLHVDLTVAYINMLAEFNSIDSDLKIVDTKAVKIRKGNIRARLRMITLYNLAAKENGLVASTDNFSELTAGFWTRFGDEGDLAPIQSLLKSWEVPLLAKYFGVPEDIWRATPTDGLGIDKGDEAQLGASYLEWDLMITQMFQQFDGLNAKDLEESLDFYGDVRAEQVFKNVMSRMGATWYKRMGTINLQHSEKKMRYSSLSVIDDILFMPTVLKH